MFVHAVYFWLKPETTQAARQQLIDDCTTYLSKVPTVRHLWVGRPAMTPRPIIDNSYDVGLLVVLDDRAGHDIYQEHPLHLEFVSRNSPNFGRVQIYDFQRRAGRTKSREGAKSAKEDAKKRDLFRIARDHCHASAQP